MPSDKDNWILKTEMLLQYAVKISFSYQALARIVSNLSL
ncbi:hypothetical protein PSAR109036_00075 [Psychrobacter arenosus]